MDETTLLKIEASLSLSFAVVASSFATCTWICRTARSSLGFRGPGFLTDSRILVVNPVLFDFSHLLLKVLMLPGVGRGEDKSAA